MLAPRHCADLMQAVAAVIDAIDRQCPGPFDRPVVMVQHRTHGRLLTLELARRHGIAASIDLLSPMQLVRRVQAAPSPDPWAAGPLRWRIARLLPDLMATHAARHPWLLDSGRGLARAIVREYRDLLLHRPALLAEWEREELSDDWLAWLWYRLAAESAVPSPAARHREWLARLNDPVPFEPLVVLADDSLPLLVRETLAVAAERGGVEWCLPDPVRDVGFAGMIGGATGVQHAAPLREFFSTGAIKAHRCHSPLREVETLRDAILRRLSDDRSIAPHDVAIYLTDLASYLPAIDGVFGAAEPGLPLLPWHVAGRRWRQRSELAAAVTALLGAVAGRFGRTDILGLLEFRVIRDAAGITGGAVPSIGRLVEEGRIRWGVDGADRALRHGLPPLDDGTWRAGLSGLARRYREADHPFLDEGSETGLVDLLIRWVERLIAVREEAAGSHRPAVWREIAERWLDTLFVVRANEDVDAMRELRQAIDQTLAEIEAVDPDAAITLDVLNEAVAELLDGAPITGELRGGVRIAALDAGAVIPARIVMIAGLDDGRWPRRRNRPSWSRFVREPQAGDPDPRVDDIRLFKEAVGSASDAVHLTWVGRSMVDNARRARSVALDALLDACEAQLGAAAVRPSSDPRSLVVDEPLQPFATQLYQPTADGSPPPGISPRWCRVAQTIRTSGAISSQRIPSLDAGPLSEVTADLLAALTGSPIAWYWRNALLLPHPPGALEEEDREPVLVGDLDRLALWNVAVMQPDDLAAMAAEVELPPGTAANTVLRGSVPELAHIRSVAKELAGISPTTASPIVVAETTISIGPVLVVAGATTILLPYPLGRRQWLQGWVRHLISSVAGVSTTTVLHGVGSDPSRATVRFNPVEDPERNLAIILQLFGEARRRPVAFFPRSALAAAAALLKGGDPVTAASKEWRDTSGRVAGEREDPIIRRFYADFDFLLDPDPEVLDEFLELTEAIAVPLLEHLVEGGR